MVKHIHNTRESSQTITINSNFAKEYNNNNTGNFTYEFTEILVRYHYNVLLSVNYIQLPISWYNVNSNNNQLVYTINTVETTLEIDKQNYDIDSLVTWLNTNWTNFTVTYDSYKNKMTYTHSTSEFTIESTSSCLKLLGLSATDHTSVGFVLTSDNVCDLSYTKAVNVCCEEISSKNIGLDGDYKNILVSIPVNADANSVLSYYNYSGKRTIITNRSLYKLHIHIEDDDGNEINLNGLNWLIEIEVDFVYLRPQLLNESDYIQPLEDGDK